MTITIRLTVPVLERLLVADPNVMMELSHAAVGAIREKYSEVLLTPEIKAQMQKEVDRAICEAKIIATQAIEQQLGQWNNASWGSKFALRPDVMASLKSATETMVHEAVKNTWRVILPRPQWITPLSPQLRKRWISRSKKV